MTLDHLTPGNLPRFRPSAPAIVFAGLAIVGGAVLAGLGCNSPASYAALGGVFVVALVLVWSRDKRLSLALGVVASLLLVFAAVDAESALLLRPRVAIGGRPASLIEHDPLLGYRPRPGVRATLSLDRFGKRIYRAVYTIDADGFRLTRGGEGAAGATVFLGDSYTFGDALNDQDTLPQQFAVASKRHDKVINTAFSGYGTHQVLRLLQSGRLDGRLGSGRRSFIYLVIDEHLRRIEGRAPTDWLGTPHFELAGPSIRYVGPYYAGPGGLLTRLLPESALMVAIGNAFMIEPKAQSTQLFGAMVQEARRIVQQRYRGQLLIVLWDEPLLLDKGAPARSRRRATLTDRIARELSARGVPYVRVSQLIPDYRAHMSDYVIAGNGHPSAALNRRLALALAQRP